MGEAKPVAYYDQVYREGGHQGLYHRHYSDLPYVAMWEAAADLIWHEADDYPIPPLVFEIGCGTGQFADLLVAQAAMEIAYKGMDWSETAIQYAYQRKLPEPAYMFMSGDITDRDIWLIPVVSDRPVIVVALEVLEHLPDDVGVIERILGFNFMVFSVPSFDSDSHVRYFSDADAVRERYEPYFCWLTIDTFVANDRGDVYYLCHGRIK